MLKSITDLFMIFLKVIKMLFKTKDDLITENLSPLPRQLAVYKTRQMRPKLFDMDTTFWIALRKAWSGWKDTLIIVKPETVVDWQKRQFKKYWWKKTSRNRRPGRKRIDESLLRGHI